jgi:hypothetical protein
MQPTYYAAFLDAEKAETALTALRERGIASEDLSLLANSSYINRREEAHLLSREEHLDEATDVHRTGISDAHIGATASPQAEPGFGGFGTEEPEGMGEGSYDLESRIGGGISTSTRDDSVSGVEEMDDAQLVAEDQLEPAAGISYGAQESGDVFVAARTGMFNTTKPTDASGQLNHEAEAFPDSELTVVDVPGLGLSIGDGPMATSALGFGSQEAGVQSVTAFFEAQGMPREVASDYAEALKEGGGILAATIPEEVLSGNEVHELLEELGGRRVGAYLA